MAKKPVLVTTVLGSCIAVTLFSPATGIGAICHAMLPDSRGNLLDLRYVDAAIGSIYGKMVEYGAGGDLLVKLFGGANVIDFDELPQRKTIGEQNIAHALAYLDKLGLTIAARDVGGVVGRKLLFCTREGDVYLRRMGNKS